MKGPKAYFSGMLNQHEFIQRHNFTTQRIANGFARIDMGFLLGRSIYDIVDYEQLCEQTKINISDKEISILFKKPVPSASLFFSKVNDSSIANEKRIIRGTVIENEHEREIHFSHPWAVRRDSTGITIVENLCRFQEEEGGIQDWVSDRLEYLISYLNDGCTGLFLYQELAKGLPEKWEESFTNALVSAVYDHVHSGKLKMCHQDGRIIYKSRK